MTPMATSGGRFPDPVAAPTHRSTGRRHDLGDPRRIGSTRRDGRACRRPSPVAGCRQHNRGAARVATLVLAAAVVLAALLFVLVFALNRLDEASVAAGIGTSARTDKVTGTSTGAGAAAGTEAQRSAATPAQIARGEYLARVGNCIGCHTARGGPAGAGGRGIETPFGTAFAPNLTPDDDTGLGRWSADEFWRALHNGRSRDGRWLLPAFPYPNYTQVTRDDSDAIHAYLRSLAPVRRPATPHALRFPYDTQAALAVWRALYFRPGAPPPDPARGADWNRGRYLVNGLGHCAACHGARNRLGATVDASFGGGLLPAQKWYAPSLASRAEAGVDADGIEPLMQLLRTGRAPRRSALGPMAEVVLRSTQFLDDGDLRAMATYLSTLPGNDGSPAAGPAVSRPASGVPVPAAVAVLSERGGRLYGEHCAACHGERGEGVGDDFPALAGNRAVTMAAPTNLIRIVIDGGFLPPTAANPRPHGMPPFGHRFDDAEVAAVISYIRGAWGNAASPVSPQAVLLGR